MYYWFVFFLFKFHFFCVFFLLSVIRLRVYLCNTLKIEMGVVKHDHDHNGALHV